MTKPLRCAIYTRKSTEEGLDQAFNSLHAQRESCEAYVRSQAGEGWRVIPTLYDDGGISGGTMNRPALTQLLADIAAGRVDVVVVYKVDRLTRSLADFAKIVELFDRHGVSFVSITQAFNTTSSMGRLTLNVLLSFAQFEREVTSERIRDKIAASKRKGLWMGGALPLGYDANGRTLAINEAEAQVVRQIFARYLELGSVHELVLELAEQGVRSKPRTTKSGKKLGGVPMARGALYHLLSNRIYLGQITHKNAHYPGQHAPIIDQETFEAAQARLELNVWPRRRIVQQEASPLMGKLFDASGERMGPSHAFGKMGRRYRYYVSSGLAHGVRNDRAHIRRLPAGPTETFVKEVVVRLAGLDANADWSEIRRVLKRAQALADAVVITLDVGEHQLPGVRQRLSEGERAADGTEEGQVVVNLPIRLARRGGRMWMTGAEQTSTTRPRKDRALIAALRSAHRVLRAANASPLQPANALRYAEGAYSNYERKIVRLAFLAPDIQEAILAGRQPAGLNLKCLVGDDLPGCWSEQRKRFGFRP